MHRKKIARVIAVVGVVLALMLAGGAPDDFGIRSTTTAVGGR
jgi:hypothetical protein